MLIRRSLCRAAAAVTTLALLAAGPVHAVTGVCPDGSIFIVQDADSIPCREARTVEPHEVPPVRPEYLPRPYGWQVYQEGANPNNPYNLVEQARQVRALQGRGGAVPPVADGPGGPEAAAGGGVALPAVAARPPGFASDQLGLRDDELRDLFLIVELAQEHAPAAFIAETADGRERARVAVAHSSAFQQRFTRAAAGRGALAGGHVLLFSAVAHQPEPFYANFTFTQDYYAFHPDARDPHQLGVLYGRLGSLAAGDAVLGYVVVPDSIDLRRPLDVYWNDRRTSATLLP